MKFNSASKIKYVAWASGAIFAVILLIVILLT